MKELFSTLWGIHLVAMVFDYALKLSILLSCDFFCVFSCKISFFFFWCVLVFFVDGYLARSCDFDVFVR